MIGLLFLGVLAGLVLLIPLMILGAVLRLVLGIAFLPIRLAGFAVKLTFGLVLGLVGAVVGLALLLAGLLALGAVVLVPLLPFLAIAGGIWLVWRIVRRPRLAHPAV